MPVMAYFVLCSADNWACKPHHWLATGRTALEVLQDFPSACLPLQWLLQTVPHLKPRQFSLASALSQHPRQAHLTVAVVDYQTPFRRHKRGLCSSWLASLAPGRQC